MALLGNYDDKLMQDDQQGQVQTQSTITPTAGTSGVVTGGQGGSGVSTAGVGAGGTGGWTNIQAYLGANKNDNGAAGLLQNKAGGQYDTENQNLQTQASNTRTQAEGEAKKINDAKDNSKEWVNQAANAYSWSGQQTDPYNQNVGKLKSAINDQYQGPDKFAYGKSADFQKTGAALGDNGAFNNYMNDIYKDKAGGQLSSGQGALQTQLDVNNQNLADARKNLLTQYSGFDDTLKNTVSSTDAAIQKAKTDYGNNQAGLKSHLSNLGNDYQTQIDQAEADARAGYNDTFNNEGSGRAGYGNYAENNLAGGYRIVDLGGFNENLNKLRSSGLTGDNLKWAQLQEEQNIGDIISGRYARIKNNDWGEPVAENLPSNLISDNASALNNFYSEQDAKYSNTADEQERNWNTIMDILGKTDRKAQGFQVRG